MSEGIIQQLEQAVIEGLPEDAEMLANQALAQGLDPLDCINEGLTPGIQRVGELFASGEYFLPELIVGADAMELLRTFWNQQWWEIRNERLLVGCY